MEEEIAKMRALRWIYTNTVKGRTRNSKLARN